MIPESGFEGHEAVLQLGVPPSRIDIITRADGISFADAARSGASITLRGRSVPIIGLAALLENKRASGRPQDLADVAALEALLRP